MRADIARQEEYNRFLPLVKWLLAIPHYFCLFFLGLASFVVILIAFFAVLFTGRYPEGMFNFVVGVHRWGWRVAAYVYLLTDEYPPFTLEDVPDYPARFTVDYPEHIDNWRPLVQWLLIIPFFIVAYVLTYLSLVLVFFAFFTILFTKQFNEGMFKLVVNALRWAARANTYEFWLVEEYPPFEFEDAGNPGAV
jgi:hypothetical protein